MYGQTLRENYKNTILNTFWQVFTAIKNFLGDVKGSEVIRINQYHYYCQQQIKDMQSKVKQQDIFVFKLKEKQKKHKYFFERSHRSMKQQRPWLVQTNIQIKDTSILLFQIGLP
eukprot:TRINITY_DN6253_c2_g1_i1.p6 TRINITY_DN6253_c2_g1~~TRINITY_DN6253_c2_g1_i1.p6  ORF type:complete len:114 (+),score=0.68 TRINITY_DN6253_c2_g1_i1:336-677(+)